MDELGHSCSTYEIRSLPHVQSSHSVDDKGESEAAAEHEKGHAPADGASIVWRYDSSFEGS